MRSRTAVFLFLALLLPAAASAQTTYTWDGSTGPWNEAIRWSPQGVPGAGDVVHISSGTATLSGNTTIASLHLSNLGVIAGNADLTITDSMVWSAVGAGIESLGGTGTVTVAPGATLSMTAGTLPHHRNFRSGPNRTFVNAGSAVWSGSGEWGGQGQFINEGDLELAYDAEEPTRLCFSSTSDAVVNAASGIIRRTGAGELIVYCQFTNHGLVEIEQGTFRLRDWSWVGGTDTGAYEIHEDAVLIFDGNRILTETASVSGAGIVRTGGSSTQPTTINGTFSIPTIEAFGGVILDFNSDTTVERLLMGEAGNLSSGQIGGSATLTVTEELRWINGYMSGSGMTVVAEGATFVLDVQSSYTGMRDSRSFINEGVGTWTSDGGRFSHSKGDFENRGLLTVSASGNAADFFSDGRFVNADGGVLRRMGEGRTRFSSGFENHGIVEILEGTLDLNGFNWIGGTDAGAYVLADGTRLEFNGGVRTLTETASIAGTGTIVFPVSSDWRHVTNNAMWRPGTSPGTLTIDSDYPAEKGVLEIELGGFQPGAEYDQLVVRGKARLGGTLRLDVLGGFTPQPGDFFTVVTAEEVVGAFDVVEGAGGYTFGVGYTDTTVVVAVAGSVCQDGLLADEYTVALYKFDEPEAGVSFDASGNDHDGVDYGTTVVEGRFCNARLFNGESDRIDMDAARVALQGSTEWTIEYVAKSVDGAVIPALINHSCGNGWWFGTEPNGIRHTIKTTGVGGNCPWTVVWTQGLAEITLDTLWHYYAMTWDADSLRVYRDGSILGSRPAGGMFELNQTRNFRAWIGYSDHDPMFYTGLADELRISDVSRGADEIRQTAEGLGFIQPSVSVDGEPSPRSFALHSPYPNPFTAHATIGFDLPEAAPVRLTVYDVLGRRVAVLVDDALPPGRHEARLDAEDLSAGIYLVHLQAGRYASTQRVVRVR